MKGDAEVLDLLNTVLTHELTAINQYFIHSKMCKDWGYHRLAEYKRKESIAQMWHADAVIDRILLLDGVPNMQRMNPVRVGETVPEQHQVDLEMSLEGRDAYNQGIALCRTKGDNGTRDLLERILHREEEAIDWLEAQTHILGEIGTAHYLAEQLGEPDEDG